MRKQDVQQLLNLIDNASLSATITKDNMFEPSTRLYFTIKAMYQSFKKDNQFQLLQDKIHKIVIKQQSKQNRVMTRATANTICNSDIFTASDINNMILIKRFLTKQGQAQILQQVINQVGQLTNLKDVLYCFSKILKTPQCIQQKTLYKYVQKQMIDNILKLQIKDQDFIIIGNFIIGLPFIKQPILDLIGNLFYQVKDINSFQYLYFIFQKNFPQKPDKQSIKSLLKISNIKSIKKIIQLIDQQTQDILMLAQNQAKNKLSITQLVLTQKVKNIIDFIILIVGFGCSIWPQIIDWQKRASQQCRQCLKNKIQNILVNMMRNQSSFATVLNIASKMTQVQQKSQISKIFLNQFINIKQKKYLNNIIIRKFLAIKILNNQQDNYFNILFNQQLLYIQILLEMFNYQKQCIKFYKNIIQDNQKQPLFINFLNLLKIKQPAKFKQFFIRIDQTSKGQLLEVKKHLLIRYLTTSMPIQLAFSYFRDISLLIPSRFCIALMSGCLRQSSTHPNHSILRLQIFRTLNIILIQRSLQQFNKQFKSHLSSLLMNITPQQKQLILKDVSPFLREQLCKLPVRLQ